MVTLGDAIVYLRGESKDLDDAFKDGEEKAKGFVDRAGGMLKTGLTAAGGVAAAGVAVVGAMFVKGAQDAIQEEQAMAGLSATVARVGGDMTTFGEKTETALLAMLKLGTDSGDSIGALDLLTQSTKNYDKSIELLPKAVDLAAARHLDLRTAAMLVGKVAEGNTGILGKYAIEMGKDATATEALAEMTKRFGGAAAAMSDTTAGKIGVAKLAFGEFWQTLGGLVLPGLGDLAGRLSKVALDLLPKAAAAVPHLSGAWTEGVALITGTGGDWDAFNSHLTSVFGQTVANAMTDGAMWVAGQSGHIETIKNIFKTGVEFLRNVAQTVLAELTGIWQAHGQEWLTTITSILGLILNIVGDVLRRVKEFWDANGADIVRIVSAAWNFIKSTVETAIGLVLGIVQGVLQILSGDWETGWATIKTTLLNTWDAIQAEILPKLEALVKLVLDKIGDIKKWLGERVEDFKELGRNLISAIARGAEDAAQHLIDAMRGVVGNAISAAKRLLGIESPSKVFREMGRGIADGLALGMVDGTPMVLAAGEVLAEAAVGGLVNKLAEGGGWTSLFGTYGRGVGENVTPPMTGIDLWTGLGLGGGLAGYIGGLVGPGGESPTGGDITVTGTTETMIGGMAGRNAGRGGMSTTPYIYNQFGQPVALRSSSAVEWQDGWGPWPGPDWTNWEFNSQGFQEWRDPNSGQMLVRYTRWYERGGNPPAKAAEEAGMPLSSRGGEDGGFRDLFGTFRGHGTGAEMPGGPYRYAGGGAGTTTRPGTPDVGGGREVHLHIGTFIGDQAGLRQLESLLRRYRELEDTRRA